MLVTIINSVLKNNNISNTIEFHNLLEINEIKKRSKEFKVVCIGNENMYNLCISNGINNIKFYPYNNTKLYCNANELIELQHMLQKYAYNTGIELEVIEAKNLEEAIEEINSYNKDFIAILLTKNEEDKRTFKTKIKLKNIFINENPFVLGK